MTDLSVTQYNPYNMYQSYGYSYPAFRGATVSNASIPNIPQLRQQPDTVSFSANGQIQAETQKQGLSKGAKWCIGTGVVLGLGALAYVLTKGKVKSNSLGTKELEKLVQEKLKITELPTCIEFKEAKTIEEAIKYSKEVLKIPQVDNSFSLEALNWVNRGLTNVSNMNKGKAKMPNALKYIAEKDWHLGEAVIPANISNELTQDSFGILSIEKRLFDDNILDGFIRKSLFKPNGEFNFGIKNGVVDTTSLYSKGQPITLDKDMASLIEKYYQNPKNLTLAEKRLIYFGMLQPAQVQKVKLNGNPLNLLVLSVDDNLSTIYHEQGHLQDMAKNYLKALEERNGVAIHWNRRDALSKDIINNSPLLKSFFSTEEQNIVGKVSDYAKSGIGEFIAETYAKLIKKEKLSDDVMALYKKYGGPSIS